MGSHCTAGEEQDFQEAFCKELVGRTVVLDREEGCTVLRLRSNPPPPKIKPPLSGSLSLISLLLGAEVAKLVYFTYY